MALTGKELLAAVKRFTAEGMSRSAQAKACGYERTVAGGKTAGKAVADVHGFANALLEAQGISFPETTRGAAPKGQLTVSRALTIVIGKAYLSQVAAVAGKRYEVQIEDDGAIVLVPVEGDAEAPAAELEAVAA